MIGLSKKELETLVHEMQKGKEDLLSSEDPRDRAVAALVNVQTKTLLKVAESIDQNNQCLEANISALYG